MKYKTNFKVIILVHLVVIILLGCLFSFISAANAGVLNWVIGVFFLSMVLQLVIVAFKPGWFKDKIRNHPDLPLK